MIERRQRRPEGDGKDAGPDSDESKAEQEPSTSTHVNSGYLAEMEYRRARSVMRASMAGTRRVKVSVRAAANDWRTDGLDETF